MDLMKMTKDDVIRETTRMDMEICDSGKIMEMDYEGLFYKTLFIKNEHDRLIEYYRLFKKQYEEIIGLNYSVE